MEVWKKIEGFDYFVSSFGRVKNLKNKLMSPWKIRQGYLQVGLSKDGKRFKFLVHRLVAEAFIDNAERKDFVNHKNLDKSHNFAENLEWVTKEENIEHFHQNSKAERTTYTEEFKTEVANFDGGMLESKRFYNLPTSTVQRWRKELRVKNP